VHCLKIYLPLLSYRKTNFDEEGFQERLSITDNADKTVIDKAPDQAEAEKANKVY
jgi:hypothetical protein